MYTNEGGDGYNYGVIMNNVCLCLASVIVVGYPIWLYIFLKKNYYDLQFAHVKEKYGNAYEGV
jgi:hypothetical protein